MSKTLSTNGIHQKVATSSKKRVDKMATTKKPGVNREPIEKPEMSDEELGHISEFYELWMDYEFRREEEIGQLLNEWLGSPNKRQTKRNAVVIEKLATALFLSPLDIKEMRLSAHRSESR